MLRPVSLLPALVAVASLAAWLLAPTIGPTIGPLGTPAYGAARSQAEETPLSVTIDTLTPSTIPRKGTVRVRGTVTNHDVATWRMVRLYAFVSSTPMTTRAELAEAAETDPETFVGERIVDPGTYDTVEELAPGESAQYSFRVPRSHLPTADGVYWFGVHALGESDEGRDESADGRARTFLPLVSATDKSVETALVIPVRRAITHAADGSIAHLSAWTRSLSTGALRSLVDLGAAAGSRQVTWLVDPAVIDAVQRLAAGNPPRSLAPTVSGDGDTDGDTDGDESQSPSPSDQASPTDGTSGDGDKQPELTPTQTAAAAAARAWLDRLHEGLLGNQVLALPYGDVDVAAAAAHDPAAYRQARKRSSGDLQPWGLPTSPAVSSPTGYLDEPALRLTAPTDTVIVSDQMLGGAAPTVARTADRALTVSSTGAASGGPGPDDPLAPIAVRQRILSEAALRLLAPGDQPLVVVFPSSWSPELSPDFFTGLDLPWLDLTSVATVDQHPAKDVPVDRLSYPETQTEEQLGAANFTAATDLTHAGDTLQNLLTRNDRVGGEVRDEALSDTSYFHRPHPERALLSTNRSRAWIDDQLESVRIDAPKAVVLSSGSGRFAATVTNGLDQPVTVNIAADPEPPLKVAVPADSVDLGPNSRTTILLNASSSALGIRNVTLFLTDVDNVPLGSSDELPIRSNRVSNVIWLILGTGVALLFGAIVVRLFRRIRAARRT